MNYEILPKERKEWKTSTICIFVNKSPSFLCERGIHPSAVTNDPINTNIVFKIWRRRDLKSPSRGFMEVPICWVTALVCLYGGKRSENKSLPQHVNFRRENEWITVNPCQLLLRSGEVTRYLLLRRWEKVNDTYFPRPRREKERETACSLRYILTAGK